MTTRRREITNSLRMHLDEASVKDSHRALWVADHLVEYVERLAGFARHTEIQLSELLKGDLIDTVEAGADVFAEELVKNPPNAAVRDAWRQLQNAKTLLLSTPSHEGVEQLVSCAESLQRTVRVG